MLCHDVYQMASSDKENHVADKQADELPVSNVSLYSSEHSAAGVSPVVITVPSTSLSRAADAGVPVPASSCPPVTGVPLPASSRTPVTGSTSMLASSRADDLMSAVTRFI